MRAHLVTLLLVMPACSASFDAERAADLLAMGTLSSEVALADTGDPAPACDAASALQPLLTWVDRGGGPPPPPARPPRYDVPPPPAWPLLVFVYDTDGNHVLDKAERKAMEDDFTARCQALQQRDQRPPPPPRPPHPPAGKAPNPVPPPLMERFDTNRDGTLSAKEAAALRDSVRKAIRDGDPPGLPPPPPKW